MSQNDNYEDFLNSDEYAKLLDLLQNGTNNEVELLLDTQSTQIPTPTNPKLTHSEQTQSMKVQIPKEFIDTEEKPNNYSLGFDEGRINKMKRRNNKNRCGECNAKLKLFDYTCKCEIKFCRKHKHPEEHFCNFDHKKRAREQIENDNPVVVASKIHKI